MRKNIIPLEKRFPKPMIAVSFIRELAWFKIPSHPLVKQGLFHLQIVPYSYYL